jgi:hypothetical protein
MAIGKRALRKRLKNNGVSFFWPRTSFEASRSCARCTVHRTRLGRVAPDATSFAARGSRPRAPLKELLPLVAHVKWRQLKHDPCCQRATGTCDMDLDATRRIQNAVIHYVMCND